MNSPLSKPLHTGHRARVKEKFLKSGGKELNDYELLEMLLFSAYTRHDTKKIAKKLLEKFKTLAAILSADITSLRQIGQISDSAIIALKVNFEIINRIFKKEALNQPILNNWPAIANYAKICFNDVNYEVFRVWFLNRNYKLINDEIIFSGQNDQVIVNIKAIVKKALLLECSSLILLHNHPSGNLSASKHDMNLTNEIQNILKPLNISLLDHLIVANNEIFSFKERGLL